MIAARRDPPPEARVPGRFLESRALAPAIGLVTALAFFGIWSGSWKIAPYADEASYLFQAKIFAAGHWSMPSPPLPEFFEQGYVLVTPRYASLYFPGHPLMLVPGIWFGFPPLMPLLELGAIGALLFVLARDIAGPAIGLLSWVLWLTAPIHPWLRPSYLSETTTGMLWLAAWLAVLRWRQRGSRLALVLCAVAVGWGFLTRPLTMMAFAFPLALVSVLHARRKHLWRDLAAAAAAGAVVLAVLPLWSFETTGNPLRWPYLLYTRQYTPWTLPLGENPSSVVAQRPLPPDLESMMKVLQQGRGSFEATPRLETLGRRCLRIGKEMWGARPLPSSAVRGWQRWRLLLFPFFLVGCALVGRKGRLGLATAACLVLAYLPFWQGSDNWMAYYLELQPVLAFLTAVGLERVTRRVFDRARERDHGEPRGEGGRAALVVASLLLMCGSSELWIARRQKEAEGPGQRAFERAVAAIPEPKAIVFVRYGPKHNASFTVHFSVINNEPDLPRARIWIVYDRGSDNARLLAIARDRTPYLYDEARGALIRMPASSAALLPAGATAKKRPGAAIVAVIGSPTSLLSVRRSGPETGRLHYNPRA